VRLTELKPSFLSIESEKAYKRHDDLATAQGIVFVCPRCFVNKGGLVGAHSIMCWFNNRGVPPTLNPLPGRWNPSGTGYTNLSFVGPGACSVLIEGGCNAHFLIGNGEVTLC
jgi:hypothetical protein